MVTKIWQKGSAKPKSGIQKWRRPDRQIRRRNLSTAELAECTCPEFCERDHANE